MAMATVHARRAKPPGLPHGKVRTAAQLLQNPDMLAHLSVFDTQHSDLVHWRVGFQRFFASRSPEHVEHQVEPDHGEQEPGARTYEGPHVRSVAESAGATSSRLLDVYATVEPLSSTRRMADARVRAREKTAGSCGSRPGDRPNSCWRGAHERSGAHHSSGSSRQRCWAHAGARVALGPHCPQPPPP